MASNRPLFDDEDLPAWLTDAGITHAGGVNRKKTTTSTQPVITEPSGDFAMDWDIPAALQGPIQTPSDKDSFDVTGNLPWSQGASDESPAQPDVSGDQMPWEESGALAESAIPAEPPMLDDYPTPIGLPPEPPTEQARIKRLPRADEPAPLESEASTDDLSWLDQSFAELTGEQTAPPTEPLAGEIKRIKKLPKADEPALEQPPADAPKPEIKRLPGAVQGTQVKPAEPELVSAEMTFEEWERQQSQPQPEAQSDPSDKLLDEVPEWFSTANEPAQPEASAVPDELTADAPDWFKNMDDLSGTPLTGPESIQPPPAEAASAVADKDVPDWFKGSGVDELDFDTMFTQDTPAEPTKRPSSQLAAHLPETPPAPAETPAASITVPPVPTPTASADESLDWMADLPELDDLVGESQPAAPTPAQPTPADTGNWSDSLDTTAAEPEPVKAELPDWMQQAAPQQPIEASTPDTELDDFDWAAFEDKPAAPSPTEIATGIATAAPEAERDESDWPTFEETPGSADTLPPSGEVPDWMQQSAPQSSPSAGVAPEASNEAGNFDWLLDQNAPEPELNTTSSADADMPEWMRDLSPVGMEPAPVAKEAPAPEPAATDDMDWLSGVDFLKEPAPEPPAPADQPTEQPAEQAAEIPALKKDSGSFNIDALLSLSEDAVAAQEAPVEPVEREAAIPADFLTEEPLELPPYESPQQEQALTPVNANFGLDALFAGTPQETKPVPAQGDLLDTILPPNAPAEPASPPRAGRRVSPEAPGPALQDSPRPREELPEWIAEMQPERAPTTLRIGDQEIRVQEKPLAQLSEQLRQLREHAKTVQAQKTETAPASAGPLSGITGAIETIPDVLKPGTAMTAATPVISDVQARRVKLIQNILERDEETFKQRQLAEDEREAQQAAATIQAAPRAKPRPKIDRILLSLLLAVVIVVPFFTNAANLSESPGKQLTAAQNAVAQTIDTIQANQPVLMAFEYGPTGAGELDDLARTVVRDLVKRGARPVIVSTNAAGAMHAQSLMAVVGANANELKLMGRTADRPLVPRKDYVVLRYLPGGAAGVRAMTSALLSGGFQQNVVFTADIEGKPSGLTDADIAALKTSPAFILTESQDDVRNWVEQYQAAPNDKPLPIVLLSSASASAVAESYASSATDKHIVGPLVGLRDSMVYQAARQSPDAKALKLADQRWQSVGLGALLASVLILVGVAINLLRSLRRRKPVDTRTS